MKSMRLLLGFLLMDIFSAHGMNQLTEYALGSWHNLETNLKIGIVARLAVQDKESMRLVNKELASLASRAQLPQMIQFPCVLDRSNHLRFMVEYSKKRDAQAHNILMWLIKNRQSCDHADVLNVLPYFFPSIAYWDSLDNLLEDENFSLVSRSDLCAIVSVYKHTYSNEKTIKLSNFIMPEIMDVYGAHQSAIDTYMEKYSKREGATTHLHVAVQAGHISVVELFLMQNPSLLCVADHQGMVPLAIALIKKNEDIIEMIVRCIKRHKITQNKGITALFAAIATKKKDIVELLLDKGALVNMCMKGQERSPLMCAVLVEDLPIVKLLVEKGANINYQTTDKTTALSLAIFNEYEDIISFLLSQPKIIIR